ncbi:unnamed protein product [Clonostachys byssicola]|uniref:Uncharacterized protein n=1 Tax=Clonostachys byssicola TaxID=160290 RepID=A0A9N9UGQ5_9HYPO|nr:unnamed protein product [Clonostachys byssicola]
MYQQFYMGKEPTIKRESVDLSSIKTLRQLQSSLGQIFAWADSSSILFHSESQGSLDSLEAIGSAKEAIELRVAGRTSVQSPPGPRVLPVVGNHYELYPDPLGNYDRLFARLGPVIKTTNMGTTIYITNDAEISRHVLREGEFFTKTTSDPSHPLFYMREQTALFTCDSESPAFPLAHKFVPPALSPRAIAHYGPLIQDAARGVLNVFEEMSERALACNIYQYMFKLAGQLVFRVMVGKDLQHFQELNTPPTLAIRLFGEYLKLMKKTSLRPQWHGYLPFGEPARLRVVRNLLFSTIETEMDNATTKGAEPLPLNDPMSPIKAACVADFLARARDTDGQGLPRDILLGNTVVLLGAGFTTTSSLLSWAIYSLVKYPGNQQRLLQELVDHGADGERKWSHDELHAMKFMDCFVKETMRLHSPSFQTGRNAKTDVVLPGGYLIPKGSIVIPCFPTIHKNPAYWDNPTRFEPDRWLDPTVATTATRKGIYSPFAAGARGCVGFNLATMQVKMVLAELVYRYEFEDASTEPVIYDPEFLVVRPLNFYASPIRRTEWPSRSTATK